jgi:hypothetical protein
MDLIGSLIIAVVAAWFLHTWMGWVGAVILGLLAFVAIAKLPFFEVFPEQSLPIIRSLNSDDQACARYQEIYEDVDDNGKSMFDRYGVPHGPPSA